MLVGVFLYSILFIYVMFIGRKEGVFFVDEGRVLFV